MIHVLWKCPTTNDVWAEVGSLLQKWDVTGDDFMELRDKLCHYLDKEKLKETVSILRGILHRRNKVVFL